MVPAEAASEDDEEVWKGMIDREKVQKGLESCGGTGMCFHGCPYHEVSQSVEGCTSQLASEALELLEEQEQTIKSATWVQHLYRLGSKRFECNLCHGTSWKPSDYCPDCGSRTDETVVNMDD